MEWTIDHGKITADGTIQDAATSLWTLRPQGTDVAIERQTLLDARRLPAIQRLSFGTARDQALADARRAIGQPETIALVVDGVACTVPPQYRAEIADALRKGGASKLVQFLGL